MNYFDDIVNCCSDLLNNFPDAKPIAEYANKRLSESALKKFGFGYFPSNNHLPVLEEMVGSEKLSKLDLIYDRIVQDGISSRKIRHSGLENHNLILPYRDVYGEIIALVGRSLLSDEERRENNIPKYKNTAFDKRKHLFGLYEAKQSIINNNIAYIVEGQFDCITAHDKGLNNVVALGSSSMTFEQFALIMRYTNNLIIMLDNDLAGRLGTEKIIKYYSKYANIKKAVIPRGYKDIDEYLSDNDINSLIYTLK